MEAGEFFRAGLGRKQLTMLGFGNSCGFHSEIMSAFPDPIGGGGYEILRVGDSHMLFLGSFRFFLVTTPLETKAKNRFPSL